MPKFLVILHDAQDNTRGGRAELKLRLVENLRISQKSVDRIFEALPVIIRGNLEKQIAERYAETLEKFGAVVEVIQQTGPVAEQLTSESRNTSPRNVATVPKDRPVVESGTANICDLERILDEMLNKPAELPAATDDYELAADVQFSAAPLFDFEENPAETDSAPRPSLLADLMRLDLIESCRSMSPAKASRVAAPAAVENRVREEPVSVEVPPPPPLHRSDRSKQALHLVLASSVLFLAGAIVLGRGPLLAMLGQGSRLLVQFDIDSLLREQASILGGSQEGGATPPAQITGQWVAERQQEGMSAKLRLTEIDNQLALASLVVTTAAPPPLTDKEFVDGKPVPAWLQRVEAINLGLLIGPESIEEFRAHGLRFMGVGKGYFSAGKEAERLAVEAHVFVRLSATEPGTAAVQWIVSRLFENPSLLLPVAVERDKAKDFRALLHGEMSAKKELTNKPVEEP